MRPRWSYCIALHKKTHSKRSNRLKQGAHMWVRILCKKTPSTSSMNIRTGSSRPMPSHDPNGPKDRTCRHTEEMALVLGDFQHLNGCRNCNFLVVLEPGQTHLGCSEMGTFFVSLSPNVVTVQSKTNQFAVLTL